MDVSFRDIIAQIIRVYYKINIEENNLHFNDDFIGKISEVKVKDSGNGFFKKLQKMPLNFEMDLLTDLRLPFLIIEPLL